MKAESAYKKEEYYIATIATIMIAFNFALLRTFNSSLDYTQDAKKYFLQAKEGLSTFKTQTIHFLFEFINALANHNFEIAQSALKSHQEYISTRHPFEQRTHLIDLKNVRKVKKYYHETQQILAELKKDRNEDEPQIID